MSNKNLLVIVVAIILIIICIVAGNRQSSDVDGLLAENNVIESTYNEVVNEVTGEKTYIVYDKNTGKEIVTLDEEDSHLLEVYKLDPTYEELPVDEPQEMQISEEMITE